MNLDVHLSEGKEVTILGLIGDTSRVDMELLSSLEIVDSVKRVSEPFKQANRKFHPADTVIRVGDTWLNPQMWTELFLENKENLLFELSFLIHSLEQYKEAIQNKDAQKLISLLEEGKLRKEAVDG